MILSSSVILWILGILVGLLASLVATIYMMVIKSQDKIEEKQEIQHKENISALEKAKDDAADTHDKMWNEINVLKDRHTNLDKLHSNWCQKHEDSMNQHDKEIAALQRMMSTYKYATAELDARVMLIDKKSTAIKH